MTGDFSGTVDFDPANTHPGNTDILTAGGDRDIFVARYAPDGSLAWVSQMTGAGAGVIGVGRSLARDGSGNIALDGYVGGQIAFGSSFLTSAGRRDGFAAKLDPNGNVLWATRWSDADNNYPWGVAVDAAGNVLTAEYNSNNAAFVRKFSPTGALVWADQIGPGTGEALGFGVATDSAGNAYVCGSFAGIVDFGPGPHTHSINGGSAAENGYVLS